MTPVRYEHDPCNVTSGAVHLLASAERKIRNAGLLVKCVRDEGLQRLTDAIDNNDIYTVILAYADCVGKLENALLVFKTQKVIYDDYLVEYVQKMERNAHELLQDINQMIEVYRRCGCD